MCFCLLWINVFGSVTTSSVWSLEDLSLSLPPFLSLVLFTLAKPWGAAEWLCLKISVHFCLMFLNVCSCVFI